MMDIINVKYPETTDTSVSVEVLYKIEQSEDIQTVTCMVKAGEVIPAWLQVRKFQVAARKVGRGFVTLYDERNEGKNLHCTLFIDLAYEQIMKKEKRRVCLQE